MRYEGIFSTMKLIKRCRDKFYLGLTGKKNFLHLSSGFRIFLIEDPFSWW